MTVFFPSQVLAHKGEKHEGHHEDAQKLSDEAKIKLVSKLYTESVQTIFKKSCFDCHGTASEMPWYHKVPLVKDMMDKDMIEAKKHLDMSKGFPFGGHGSVIGDLDAIYKSIQNNEMPPSSYRLMHPVAELSAEEKDSVRAWIESTKKALK